jgi:hypothetical protein
VAQKSLLHPVGSWILAPHPNSLSEVGWTGLVRGQTWSIRPDRVFFAPPHDSPAADPLWWIIDYKSSHNSGLSFANVAEGDTFKSEHRGQHLNQLAVYADMLRGMQSQAAGAAAKTLRIRAGIYYPRLQLFDWWEA